MDAGHHGPDHRRDRHGQRSWSRAPSTTTAPRADRAVRRRELRRYRSPSSSPRASSFGHKRGAFTDARRATAGPVRAGRRRHALPRRDRRLPARSADAACCASSDQVKSGASATHQSIKVDVRIVAATHRDLERDVAEGRFREGPVLPPERLLRANCRRCANGARTSRCSAQHFLDRLNAATRHAGRRRLPPRAWPPERLPTSRGNVRELGNEVKRAFTLADPEGCITPDLLSERFAHAHPAALPANNGSLRSAVERFETQCIRDALQRNRGESDPHRDRAGSFPPRPDRQAAEVLDPLAPYRALSHARRESANGAGAVQQASAHRLCRDLRTWRGGSSIAGEHTSRHGTCLTIHPKGVWGGWTT